MIIHMHDNTGHHGNYIFTNILCTLTSLMIVTADRAILCTIAQETLDLHARLFHVLHSKDNHGN